MKILLIHQYFLEDDDPGGSRFNELVKLWTDRGNEVVVLAGMMHYSGHEKRKEYKGKWLVKKQQGRVTVWRSHVSESYNKHFLGRLWAYFSFVFSSLYTGIFRVGNSYDCILVTSPPLFVGISALLLSKWKRVPFIFEVRDLWPESAIDTGVLKNKLIIKFALWFEQFIYKRSKLINVLTPAFKQKLIEKGVPKDKIIFIPNAADFMLSDKLLDEFDAEGWRVELKQNKNFVITYVGAHGVANHLVQLLDAAERLEDTNVIFQLIGDGMEKKNLMTLAQKRNIDNVIFLDSVPKQEVFKYILGSDMGTSVLKNVETFKTIFSNKTFDYMACKRPVLMLIDGISRSLVDDAGCGYYAQPENIDEIELTIRRILSEQHLLKGKGENGYSYAKKHFDRQLLGQRYLEHLESVAN